MVTEDITSRILAYIREQTLRPHDEIAELVSSSHEQFLAVITELGEGLAARKPAAHEWSVRELVRHVILAEQSVAGVVAALARGNSTAGDRLGPAGGMLHDDGRPWAAYIELLRETNASLLAAIRGLQAAPDVVTTARHPLLGPLNCVEWAVSHRVHDADHIQHAQRIVMALAQQWLVGPCAALGRGNGRS
jgi:hypothetical protein